VNIKIRPNRISGEIESISSKSMLHRAIILSSIAINKKTKLKVSDIISNDIQATVNCMKELGAKVELDQGCINIISLGNNLKREVNINCGESGTTLRLILPIANQFSDKVIIDCDKELRKRPIEDLIITLEESGLYFDDYDFPITIRNKIVTNHFKIKGDVSSQYISGLLFLCALLNEKSFIELTTRLESSAYVDMTVKILKEFGILVNKIENNNFEIYGGRKNISIPKRYRIEGDWSNSAFFIVGGCLGNSISVSGLELNSSQGDESIVRILKEIGGNVSCFDDSIISKESEFKSFELDFSEIPDLFPILAVVASVSRGTSILKGAKRLKYKESDRIKSTFHMLKSLGADVDIIDDGLVIRGKKMLDGGMVNSCNDHRIVMASTIASIRSKNEVLILNAESVDKSYPNFFEDFKKVGGFIDVII